MKTILVAIDFSKNADHALEFAIIFSEKLEASVYLIWVDNTVSDETVLDTIKGDLRIENKEYLKNLTTKYLERIPGGKFERESNGRLQVVLHESTNVDEFKEQTDSRINNLNKLHDQEMNSKIKALRDEQRVAVSEADTERFDNVQKQIDDINVTPEVKDDAPQKDPAITEWEKANEWSQDSSNPKLQAANGFLAGYLQQNPNAPMKDALVYVDKQIAETFSPPTNPRRETANTNERGRQSSKNKGGIGMADLTQEELFAVFINIRNVFASYDETKFLRNSWH